MARRSMPTPVKWNLERILDPKIGHSFNRSALIDVDRITVDDKWIVQCHLKEPSAAFDSNLIYYPVNLIAPGAVDKADTEPVGCGPFKFKSWKRFDICELVRFENFWETDSEGNTLPYLDGTDRPAQEGGSRAADRAARGRARPDRQRRLCRRALLHQGLRQDLRHLPGAPGRHGLHRLQPQERAVLGQGQSRRPHAAPGGGACHRSRGHPRGGVQQAGRDRQGLLQQGEPLVLQGHQVVAGIRSRQGQGAAQEGQGRRRQAPDHRQRQLPLHAAVGRAGARHAEGRRLQRRRSRSIRRR